MEHDCHTPCYVLTLLAGNGIVMESIYASLPLGFLVVDVLKLIQYDVSWGNQSVGHPKLCMF